MHVARVRRVVAIVVGLLTMPGAAGFAQEKPHDLIRAATVHGVVITPQTRFSSNTLKNMLLSLPGAPSRAGADLLERFGIPDPAVRLRDRFLAGLGQNHAAEVRIVPGVQGDDPRMLAKTLGAGFALDFRTRIWKTLAFSMDTKHHKIEYWGRGRLVRLADGKVLWDETCKYMGDAPKGQRPTMEDMLANDAALLKTSLEAASDYCQAELLTKFGVR